MQTHLMRRAHRGDLRAFHRARTRGVHWGHGCRGGPPGDRRRPMTGCPVSPMTTGNPHVPDDPHGVHARDGLGRTILSPRPDVDVELGGEPVIAKLPSYGGGGP